MNLLSQGDDDVFHTATSVGNPGISVPEQNLPPLHAPLVTSRHGVTFEDQVIGVSRLQTVGGHQQLGAGGPSGGLSLLPPLVLSSGPPLGPPGG